MNLGLEALNTTEEDVNFDLGDMSASLESIVIDLHDSIYNINQSAGDVEALIVEQGRLESAMEQLEDIKTVIAKSGVTPALLDIVNDKQQLDRALGITIPAMFVDEDARIAAGTACMEALNIKANLGKAWIAVKKFFLEMIKRVKDFIKNLINGTMLHVRALKKLQDKLGALDKFDEEAFAAVKVTGLTLVQFKDKLAAANGIATAYTGASTSGIIDAINKAGWKMKSDGTITGNPKADKNENTCGNLGWKLADVKAQIIALVANFASGAKLQGMQRATETGITAGIRYAEEAAKGAGDEAAKTAIKAKIKAEKENAIISSRALAKYGQLINQLSVQLIAMASKAKVKSDK